MGLMMRMRKTTLNASSWSCFNFFFFLFSFFNFFCNYSWETIGIPAFGHFLIFFNLSLTSKSWDHDEALGFSLSGFLTLTLALVS